MTVRNFLNVKQILANAAMRCVMIQIYRIFHTYVNECTSLSFNVFFCSVLVVSYQFRSYFALNSV